jgi:hypothetical protein
LKVESVAGFLRVRLINSYIHRVRL